VPRVIAIFTSPAGAVAKYCDEYVSVRLSVCLSARISPEPHARSLPNLLCMLPMYVARSSSGTFTTGRIAYRREGVFFPIENALSAGKGRWGAQRGRSMLSTIALFLLALLPNEFAKMLMSMFSGRSFCYNMQSISRVDGTSDLPRGDVNITQRHPLTTLRLILASSSADAQ